MIRKNGVVLYLECSTHCIGHYVVHVFILPLFPSFFTPPLPLSSISHQVSHRECVTTLWIWGSSPNANSTKQCYQSIRNDVKDPLNI